jgi:hypothetical protein
MNNDNTSVDEALVCHSPELERTFQPVQELCREAQDFLKRSSLLSDDVALCDRTLRNAPDDQFWRRIYVRSVFVLIEACSYGLKRIALHRHSVFDISFSPSELALLREEKHGLNDKGEVYTQDNFFQKFLPNFKFAVRSFAKSHGVTFELNASSVPLKEFENLRNRITHPKKLAELAISDSEITKTDAVAIWFSQALSALLKESNSGRVLPRIPYVHPSRHWNVTKPFILLQVDGTVYQFDTLEEAEARQKAGIAAEWPFLVPVLLRTEDVQTGSSQPGVS